MDWLIAMDIESLRFIFDFNKSKESILREGSRLTLRFARKSFGGTKN